MAGTLSVNLHSAYVLFDTGATFSCVAESFVAVCGLCAESMCGTLSVSTPLGSRRMLNLICRDVNIEIGGSHLPTDLVVLDMVDFDVILGVDWLYRYKAVIDCHSQTVELKLPEGDVIIYKMEDQRPPTLPSYELWGKSSMLIAAMVVEEELVVKLA